MLFASLYVRIGIFLTCSNNLHESIISIRGDDWVHKTSLIPAKFYWTKNYKINIGWLGIKIMCSRWTTWLLCQWASTIKIQLSVLVYYIIIIIIIIIIISLKISLFSPWKIAELALINNHSLPLQAYTSWNDIVKTIRDKKVPFFCNI